jgi:hypothetical protein
MTHNDSNHEFDRAVRAVRNDQPNPEQVREAASRLWQKLDGADAAQLQSGVIRGCEDIVQMLPAYHAGQLPSDRAAIVKAHLHECSDCRKHATGRDTAVNWTPALTQSASPKWPRFAFAAAIIVLAVSAFLVHNIYFAIPAGARASVEAVDGVVYHVTPDGDRVAVAGDTLSEGDLLRTASGSHAFVKLSDGSLVEVNERTDFTVKARGKNMTVALDRGAVIVQAAKRTSGHLYVKTPDARVAVTGTVFSVLSGIKGSRVSVVEGTVDVTHSGSEDILHAGDQVVTGDNMETIPVGEDIAWSRNLSKHLELLAQFAQLQRRLEQVQMPAPRYNSTLMERMPANIMFYASIPNAGQALEDANRILKEQMQQSDALRNWWTHGSPENQQKFDGMIAKIRQLSDYLGEEVVVVGFDRSSGLTDGGFAVVADIRRSGLKEFLESQFAVGDGEHMNVVDASGLSSLPEHSRGPVALVLDNNVVFSGNRDVLQHVSQQLASGSGGLQKTDFGRNIAEAYSRGAGFFFAANVHQLMMDSPRRTSARAMRHSSEMQRSGLNEMKYLIVEHREINGVPDNRMLLDFAGNRTGVASWLAAPAPMGSLEFVSRNASVAFAVISKDPSQMLDDMLNMSGNRAKAESKFAEAESKFNLRLREDLVAHFGGDAVIALDGPVLPTPSWKVVVEVHDPAGLAASIEKLVQGMNQELQQQGKPGAELTSEEVSGQRYYSLRNPEKGNEPMHFTFAAGYMIIGPSRAVLMNTLRTRATGDSLARSGEFKALLPKDNNANYSAIAYQNLAPVAQPLLEQMTGDQAKLVQQLIVDSRPSVICAWGRDSRIEAVTNSRLLGFDWLTVGSLLGNGTSHKSTP